MQTVSKKVSRRPVGHWKNIDNQRKFFDDLATKLDIRTPEDWSRVSKETFLQHGGSFVYTHYKGSFQRGTRDSIGVSSGAMIIPVNKVPESRCHRDHLLSSFSIASSPIQSDIQSPIQSPIQSLAAAQPQEIVLEIVLKIVLEILLEILLKKTSEFLHAISYFIDSLLV
jgi:hypothetical protein